MKRGKGELTQNYIFYADVYLVQNFLIKSSALYLTLWYQKYLPKGIMMKIFFVAFLGTCLEIMGLLSGVSYGWFLVIVHLIEVPGMIVFLIGKDKKYLMKAIVIGYFFILLINSIQEALWNLFGGNFVFLLVISCALSIILVKRVYVGMKIDRYIVSVEIENERGTYQIRGFYDTGNTLKEPYGQRQVHILSKEVCEGILSSSDSKILVPYHALGNIDGMLEVFYMKNMKIRKETQVFEINNAAIGIGDVQLFEGKGYEMILNEGVFREGNRKNKKDSG